MIESIEGKRGLRKTQTSICVKSWTFRRPTLNHNIETVFGPKNLSKGHEWFSKQGKQGKGP